jgi:hypothetical protein
MHKKKALAPSRALARVAGSEFELSTRSALAERSDPGTVAGNHLDRLAGRDELR